MPAAAEPTTADRVVARVGHKPILLSELRERARPFSLSMAAMPAWKKHQMLEGLFKELLSRRIDEELFAAMAVARRIVIGEDEIDAALERIAKDQKVTLDEVYAQALAAGHRGREYRLEVARSLLEQRVVHAFAQESLELAGPYGSGAAYQRWYARVKARALAQARKRTWIERR